MKQYKINVTKQILEKLLELPRETLEKLGKEAGISDDIIQRALDSRDKHKPTVDDFIIEVKEDATNTIL